MSKTSVFTTITPLPAGVTRQSVIDTYHNHEEMIDLNPLVIDRFRCKAPAYATAEEFHAIWYTIKDKVSYLPGGLATGSVSYHACFHDLPEGLQTHVYAPLGLDIKAKWSVGGSLPGEPKQPVELGLGIPREGLYLREDVKMKCNIMMLSFVKKTFKESHGKLVDRLVEKAKILETRAANERLTNPHSHPHGSPAPSYPGSLHKPSYSEASGYGGSPGMQHPSQFGSPASGFSPYQSPNPQHVSPYQTPSLQQGGTPPMGYEEYEKRRAEYRVPTHQGSPYLGQQQQQQSQGPAELYSEPPPGQQGANRGGGKGGFTAELPG